MSTLNKCVNFHVKNRLPEILNLLAYVMYTVDSLLDISYLE